MNFAASVMCLSFRMRGCSSQALTHRGLKMWCRMFCSESGRIAAACATTTPSSMRTCSGRCTTGASITSGVPGDPVIASVFNADLRDIIAEAVGKLSPRCREVFTLSYLESLSNKEISERLGISLSTVENHMYIALKQLRMSLSGV